MTCPQVCHTLRNLASTYDVWRYQASQLMAIGRPLVFPGFSMLPDLSTQELKLAVMRTSKLKENWSSESEQGCASESRSVGTSHEEKTDAPKALQALSSDKISLALLFSQCLSSYHIVKFKHLLLLPTRGGLLVVWDMKAKQDLGFYDMSNGFLQDADEAGSTAPVGTGNARPSGLIFSGRVHYSSRSVYYIVSGGITSRQVIFFSYQCSLTQVSAGKT